MIAEMVECLQTVLSLGHKRNSSIPAFLTPVLKNIIISLARLPLVNSYTRVPPLVCLLCFAFRTSKVIEDPWKPDMVLHLRFYNSRTSTLSWFDQSVFIFEPWVTTCTRPFLCFSALWFWGDVETGFFLFETFLLPLWCISVLFQASVVCELCSLNYISASFLHNL